MSQFSSPARQLRCLLSELRHSLQQPDLATAAASGSGKRLQLGSTQGVRFILAQYRKHAVTQEQVEHHNNNICVCAGNSTSTAHAHPSMKVIVISLRILQNVLYQVCRHREEAAHLADTYSTYLSSQRRWYELQQEYHAKGERSVPDTAKMVGFNLPHEDKIVRKAKPKTE